MIYAVCIIIGAALALGTLALLMRFDKTAAFVKTTLEKLTKKPPRDATLDVYINIYKY